MPCQIKSKPKSKSQKAVEIAKDVISRLRRKKLKIKQGNGYILPIEDVVLNMDISLQPQVELLESKCEVCALGGMLLSYVRLFNNVESVDRVDEYDFDFIFEKLSDVFPEKTLVIIEGVFEGMLINEEFLFDPPRYYLSKDESKKISQIEKRILKFRKKVLARCKERSKKAKAEAVLSAICRNIIRNKGKFILPE